MMNPTPGQNVLTHPLARMLPKGRYISQVYRLAEPSPPGLEDGFCPVWEAVPFNPGGRQTQQVRVGLQRDFHLLAVCGSSSAAGGFRFQLYDVKKKRKITDRGVSFNILGSSGKYFFLREPYPMCEENAQMLVIAQNQDTGANTMQVILYGMVRRFNYPA